MKSKVEEINQSIWCKTEQALDIKQIWHFFIYYNIEEKYHDANFKFSIFLLEISNKNVCG